jgi:hypothetical protein
LFNLNWSFAVKLVIKFGCREGLCRHDLPATDDTPLHRARLPLSSPFAPLFPVSWI